MRSGFAAVVMSAGVWGVSPAAGGVVAGSENPIVVDGKLVYPEGAAIPRYLTEVERAYIEENPIVVPRAVTPPPSGPVVCPGEYGPMGAIMLSRRNQPSWISILNQMAREITTTGDADVYMVVPTTSARATSISELTAIGADMSRVQYIIRNTDTIWIRDYGPRIIYEGGVRAIVDHTYNRPRPNDNALPSYFSTVSGFPLYELPLVHGGGNYHVQSLGGAETTRLINNENPGLTESQIRSIWMDYQNVDTVFNNAFPTSVDATQHIDMWMQIYDDDKVMISEWPNNAGSSQANICNAAAARMASAGYTVTRAPARSISGTHYTYTNVVICNDLVLIPTYTHSTIVSAGHNTQALQAWQSALPGKTIVQINCQGIVTAAGVMHCIAMHIPANSGGADPVAYLRTPRGGEVLEPGEMVEIRWSSDDDVSVVNVDLLLSMDGGSSYGTVIASAIADTGSYLWTVPDVYTTEGRVRVVARDGDGNTGWDSSETDLTINGVPPLCPGDADGNGVIDLDDVTYVVLRLGMTGAPGDVEGDADGNGIVNLDDVTFVVLRLGEGCS